MGLVAFAAIVSSLTAVDALKTNRLQSWDSVLVGVFDTYEPLPVFLGISV